MANNYGTKQWNCTLFFFLTPYMSPVHFGFSRYMTHVHVYTCTWGMCLENSKCAGDIYGVRKKKEGAIPLFGSGVIG